MEESSETCPEMKYITGFILFELICCRNVFTTSFNRGKLLVLPITFKVGRLCRQRLWREDSDVLNIILKVRLFLQHQREYLVVPTTFKRV